MISSLGQQHPPQDIPFNNAIVTYYALNAVLTFATTAQSDSVLAAKGLSIGKSKLIS